MSAAAKRRALGAAVAILVMAGLYGVADAVALWIALIAIALAALALLTLLRGKSESRAVAALLLLGALWIALLALVGFDVLVNLVHGALGLDSGTRLSIPAGLVLALVVFGFVVHWYLRRAGWKQDWAIGAAVALAFLVILAVPYLVGKLTADTHPVAAAKAPVASKLDVLLVGDGSRHPLPANLPRSPALDEFDVSYSVGYADGSGVRWTLDDGDSPEQALRALAAGNARPALASSPQPRAGADPVLLLLVDGTAPVIGDPAGAHEVGYSEGEVERWRQVAAQAAGADVPTYPLLQTTNSGRLARWRRFAKEGQAVSVQSLESTTATDAAVRLAVAAPTAQADFALAMKYRPVLLFDDGEPVPWPLSVPALFAEGRVQLCEDEGVAHTDCGSEPVTNPRRLENGGTHLRLKLRGSRELRRLARQELESAEAASAATADEATSEPGAPPAGTPPPGTPEATGTAAPLGSGSAIYVHPASIRLHGRELLYLDYWWYLPDNPVSLGGGALCGAGLVIAGITCQSHQSDWEGLTVVVDRDGEEPRIVAVQYAQHENVVRYGWGTLCRLWDGNPAVEKRIAAIGDASLRPLAFVASGTHASYPFPCRRCFQVPRPDVGEGRHDGALSWVGNDGGACGRSSCLQLLPTRLSGRAPALWNAFEGTWGEHDCFLTYYCDSGTPPAAPGMQGRYEHPAHYSGEVDRRRRYRPPSAAG